MTNGQERHESSAQDRRESWVKFLLTVLAAPLFIAALSTYVIPKIIEKSNRTEQLKSARLKKALEIGDRNRDFNGKLNRLKTRMNMFFELSKRNRLSESDLRNAQYLFEKEYTEDYLEMDRQAWWWYWDLEREGTYFELLSQDELAHLHQLSEQYGNNVQSSVNAITPLWRFLSSADYRANDESQKRVEALQAEMNQKSQQLSDERTQRLAKEMAALFARSHYEPDK